MRRRDPDPAPRRGTRARRLGARAWTSARGASRLPGSASRASAMWSSWPATFSRSSLTGASTSWSSRRHRAHPARAPRNGCSSEWPPGCGPTVSCSSTIRIRTTWSGVSEHRPEVLQIIDQPIHADVLLVERLPSRALPRLPRDVLDLGPRGRLRRRGHATEGRDRDIHRLPAAADRRSRPASGAAFEGSSMSASPELVLLTAALPIWDPRASRSWRRRSRCWRSASQDLCPSLSSAGGVRAMPANAELVEMDWLEEPARRDRNGPWLRGRRRGCFS